MGSKAGSDPWSAQGRAIQGGELVLPAQSPLWHCQLSRSVLLEESGLILLLCPYTAKETGKERENREMFEKEQQKRL